MLFRSSLGFKLPPGDVLIHAGDLTNQGSFEELQKTLKWIEEADYELKIVIAGSCSIHFIPALAYFICLAYSSEPFIVCSKLAQFAIVPFNFIRLYT